MGFCTHEDEHTSHIIALFNSYYQRPCGFMLHGRLLSSPPFWQKGGEKDDEYRAVSGTYRAHFQRLLQDCALSCGAGCLQETAEKAAV